MVYGTNFMQWICTGYCESWILSLPSFNMNSWLCKCCIENFTHICIVCIKVVVIISKYTEYCICGCSTFGGDFILAILALITKSNVCHHYLQSYVLWVLVKSSTHCHPFCQTKIPPIAMHFHSPNTLFT